MRIRRNAPVMAADDEFDRNFMDFDAIDDSPSGGSEDDNLNDQIDDLSDTVEDLQDTLDDVDEDDIGIEIDNNITGHFIAECDRCKGIFISAVVESDQEVTSVNGICPICGKETEQVLKWIIKDIKDM